MPVMHGLELQDLGLCADELLHGRAAQPRSSRAKATSTSVSSELTPSEAEAGLG